MTAKEVAIAELSTEIIEIHKSRCSSSEIRYPSLTKEAEVFRLYSNGEITKQEGGETYPGGHEQRIKPAIHGLSYRKFKFLIQCPVQIWNGTWELDDKTFVILEQEECLQFRNEMEKIINA